MRGLKSLIGKSLWTVIAAFLLVGIAWTPGMAVANDDADSVTVLFTGSLPDIVGTPERGGLAFLAAMVRAYREKDPNLIFVHGGGGFGPSVLAQYDKGVHIIDLLNDVDPDAYIVSQRDFSYGDDEFILRSSETIFPLISANIVDANTGGRIDGVLQSLLVERPRMKVGIIGATTTQLKEIYLVENTEVLDSAAAVRDQAAILRAQGADVVVAFVERSDEQFQDPEKLDLGVDVYFSGSEAETSMFDLPNAKWVEVPTDLGIGVIIEFSKKDGELALDIQLDDQMTYGRDPGMEAQVKSYAERFERLLNIPIVRTDVELDSRQSTLLFGETGFSNLIADVLREETDADVAFYNGGMIRGETVYPAGSMLTRRDIQAELPFANQLIVLNVTGADILAALEHGYARVGGGWGEFPHFSNIAVTINASLPPYERVQNVRIRGAVLNPETAYSLATTSYIAGGGDGYEMFAAAEKIFEDTSFSLFERVLANLQAKESVAPEIQNRLVIHP